MPAAKRTNVPVDVGKIADTCWNCSYYLDLVAVGALLILVSSLFLVSDRNEYRARE